MKLAGRWDFNRGQAANAWSLDVRKIDETGRIDGVVTYWGVRCKAHDTPLKEGSWRDGVLKLRVSGGADCGDMHFELKPGERRFLEGTVGADFNPDLRTVVWLDRR
jgi:hypothetical protein